MKKIVLLLGMSMVILQSCAEKDTTFLISETSVGPLQRTTPVKEIETIFVGDSIVQDSLKTNIGGKTDRIKIFEKGGKHLLTLTPSSDSIPSIENIRVFDSRYTTSSGVGLHSTFQDIQRNYGIKKIVTTLNSVVVFPKNSNLYFTIDKEELPSNLRYTVANIEAVQIPGTAKIKYLMVGWE
ncbi:hypothetical protein [Flagellimonas flava]|uniref:Uncharacterized protein n=1 Tax=Flagellimonas flava TaxID=570519 RepID=A0A1M5NPN2_9FLAO|nr:hypothetical protein [Allomuricauda flava]SHG91534.1 hypothetical protein SAMN04488116_2916 [Allomuricauda flava]